MNTTLQLEELEHLLAQKIGLRLTPDAHQRFVAMLHERAARLHFTSLEDYRIFLAGNEAAGEWEAFAKSFCSGETFFFRDHGQFDLLRLRLLPELIGRHRDDKTLRLWSAGCASGEEAYSLAMLIDMLLPDRTGWDILILGTDIDSGAITKARNGHYGPWSFRMVPAAIQQRYFRMEGDVRGLDQRIRSMVRFRIANLVNDSFPEQKSGLHDMDMILCRNVFIYFNSATVSAVAAKFSATLNQGGYLVTAHTELIGHAVRELESRLFAEGVVYQRHSILPESVPAPVVAVRTAARISLPLSAQPIRGDAATGMGTRLQETLKSPPPQAPNPAIAIVASARTCADRGEYPQAEQLCHEALVADPLAAAPYFLLAQLDQIKGSFDQAIDYLNKAIYLDPQCVAAYLELAALYERDGNMLRAQALRHAALGIVRSMPADEQIGQYERTAGELGQWLAQWEPAANNHGNGISANHGRSLQRGQ